MSNSRLDFKRQEVDQLTTLGLFYYDSNDFSTASGYFSRIVEIVCKIEDADKVVGDHKCLDGALWHLANCHYELKNYNAAIPIIQQAIDHIPIMRAYEVAMHSFGKIISDDLAEVAYYKLLGNAHYALGENENALDAYQKAKAYYHQFKHLYAHDQTFKYNHLSIDTRISRLQQAVNDSKSALTVNSLFNNNDQLNDDDQPMQTEQQEIETETTMQLN